MTAAEGNGRPGNGHDTKGTGGHMPQSASGIGVHDTFPLLGNGEPSIRRLLNLALCNRLPAFWKGRGITEEGGDYICIAPRRAQTWSWATSRTTARNGPSVIGGTFAT